MADGIIVVGITIGGAVVGVTVGIDVGRMEGARHELDEVAPALDHVPDGHSSQLALPLELWYRPDEHSTQLELPVEL